MSSFVVGSKSAASSASAKNNWAPEDV